MEKESLDQMTDLNSLKGKTKSIEDWMDEFQCVMVNYLQSDPKKEEGDSKIQIKLNKRQMQEI